MILHLCDKCGRLFLEASKLSVTKKDKKDFFAADLCSKCEDQPIDLGEIRKSKEQITQIFKDGLEGKISIRNIVITLKERENQPEVKPRIEA